MHRWERQASKKKKELWLATEFQKLQTEASCKTFDLKLQKAMIPRLILNGKVPKKRQR
ncbi:MAG: hypothetical protein QNK79_00635 [Synechococcus sp. ArSW.bin.68]|jgi:hypothetical protein